MPLVDPQILILVTLLGSLILFVTDALRYDMVAVLVVLALAATRVLTPAEAFSGFAHPAVVLVAAMYVFAAAVSRTGVTEFLGTRLVGRGTPSEAWLALRIMLVSGAMSAVLSNAAVVATLIPVLGMVARRAQLPLSRLLMPLAYGSLLGGLCSVIGTSKNIAVNEMVAELGYEPFGVFEFSLYGFSLLALGSFYFFGPGRFLLPRSRADISLSEHYQVPPFITEVLVDPSSTLINRAVGEPELFEPYGVTLLGLVRSQGEASVLAPGPYNRVRQDDVLILQGEPEAIVRLRRELHLPERPNVKVGDTLLASADVRLVEAVVPAGSTLVGQTIAEAQFRERTGCNVLAVSKHGDVQPTRTASMRLEVGDALLLQGHAPDIDRVRERRLLIVLDEVEGGKFGSGTWLTIGILAAVLTLSALNVLPLAVAALAGACALVLSKLVRAEDVRVAVDWSVLILIGGMLALGHAFEKYHLDDRVSSWLMGLSDSNLTPMLGLGIVLVASNLLTQLMSHVAAAVIMTPVALSLSDALLVSDRPFVLAVLTGASMSFMSPVAHQANAMVMGPGDYRYRDFLRAGTPLTVVLLALALLLLPIFFPF
ncbi:MAG: SLC13 family permease [Planctomycetota bacterium]